MGWKSSLGSLAGAGVGSFFGPAGMYMGSQIGSSIGGEMEEREALKNQQNYQLYLWNLQNEYNKPVNQMERLREAGLNPNLVAGSLSNSVAGSVGSSGRLNVHQADALNYAGVYQDLRQKDATTQNIEAQTRLTNIRRAYEDQIGGINYIDAMRRLEMNQIRYEILKASLPSVKESLEHKEGSWYQYWRNVGEMVHAFSPFANTVGDFVGMSDRR